MRRAFFMLKVMYGTKLPGYSIAAHSKITALKCVFPARLLHRASFFFLVESKKRRCSGNKLSRNDSDASRNRVSSISLDFFRATNPSRSCLCDGLRLRSCIRSRLVPRFLSRMSGRVFPCCCGCLSSLILPAPF